MSASTSSPVGFRRNGRAVTVPSAVVSDNPAATARATFSGPTRTSPC